jgi:hypothetical protein
MIKNVLTLFTPAHDPARGMECLMTIFRNFRANRNDVKRTSFLPLALALWLICVGSSVAQSTTPLAVLRTGQDMPVNSAVQLLEASPGATSVQFAFGFSTDEEPAPGLFFDSFTLSLFEAEGSLGVIFNTSDRAGSVWVPATPGTIFVSPDSMVRQPITFPDLSPNHAHQFAYVVTAPIPDELMGKDLNFYADLFDNGSTTHSLGWVSSVTLVPEPSPWLLAAVGLLFLFGFKWRTQ